MIPMMPNMPMSNAFAQGMRPQAPIQAPYLGPMQPPQMFGGQPPMAQPGQPIQQPIAPMQGRFNPPPQQATNVYAGMFGPRPQMSF
jgi:hypothetical protein